METKSEYGQLSYKPVAHPFLLIVGIGCQDLGWCNHSKSGKKLLAVGYEKIDSYFKIFKSLQRFRQFKF